MISNLYFELGALIEDGGPWGQVFSVANTRCIQNQVEKYKYKKNGSVRRVISFGISQDIFC
jgi:hypothetical protein